MAPGPAIAPGAAKVEPAASGGTATIIPFGTPSGSPLAAAAMPLLQLLARLRNMAHQPDPADLYERTTRALGTFEQRVRDAGVPAEQVRSAHYALCVSIDEVVLNTPWGEASNWSKNSLAAASHQDASDGGRFFELLARLQKDPAKFMPVIEIMYLCLSLGVMGRYRNVPGGASELNRVRAETCALIVGQAQGGQAPGGQELSPRWQGVEAPYTRSRSGLPVWVVYAAALAVCGGLWPTISRISETARPSSQQRFARHGPVRPKYFAR